MIKVTKVTFKTVTDSKGRKNRMPIISCEFDSVRRVKGAGLADKSADEVARILEAKFNR